MKEFLENDDINIMEGKIEARLHKDKARLNMENSARQIKQVRAKAQSLIENGKPAEASKELEKLQETPEFREYRGLIGNMDQNAGLALQSPDDIQPLKDKTEEIIKKAKKDLEEAKNKIKAREIIDAENLLKSAIKSAIVCRTRELNKHELVFQFGKGKNTRKRNNLKMDKKYFEQRGLTVE